MASKHRKRRRRLLKIAGIAAGTLAAGYFGSKLFGGGGETPAPSQGGSDAATESGGEGAISSPTVTRAGLFGMSPPVLIGAAIVVVLLLTRRR